jgi:hypothetical protein
MTKILIPSPLPSPLGGEEKGEGRFAHWDVENWDLFGA